MPPAKTPTNFVKLLTGSGLLSEQSLREIRAQFPQQTLTDRGLATQLMRRDLLTLWQLKKLLAGKHQGFFLGEYKLRSHLARGGMSSLYSAEHVTSGAQRALKVLPPGKAGKYSHLPRFLREARLASELRHKNIARVFEVVRSQDGIPFNFMAMELLHGRDLFRCVAEDGPMSIRDASDAIRQAADGLHHAHQQGLVHRDVKPGNIFLQHDGNIKIIDLGLAAISEDFDESITRDFNERVIGTADYLAPEQAIDSHSADHRADVYGLGCTLYYLLTGQPPFAKGSLAQRILAHQVTSPPDLSEFRSDVPEEIRTLLATMLEKDPGQRIPTAAIVAQSLEEWLQLSLPCPALSEIPTKQTEPPLASFARKLRRIVPGHERPKSETPTDSIRAAETQTEQPQSNPRRC